MALRMNPVQQNFDPYHGSNLAPRPPPLDEVISCIQHVLQRHENDLLQIKRSMAQPAPVGPWNMPQQMPQHLQGHPGPRVGQNNVIVDRTQIGLRRQPSKPPRNYNPCNSCRMRRKKCESIASSRKLCTNCLERGLPACHPSPAPVTRAANVIVNKEGQRLASQLDSQLPTFNTLRHADNTRSRDSPIARPQQPNLTSRSPQNGFEASRPIKEEDSSEEEL